MCSCSQLALAALPAHSVAFAILCALREFRHTLHRLGRRFPWSGPLCALRGALILSLGGSVPGRGASIGSPDARCCIATAPAGVALKGVTGHTVPSGSLTIMGINKACCIDAICCHINITCRCNCWTVVASCTCTCISTIGGCGESAFSAVVDSSFSSSGICCCFNVWSSSRSSEFCSSNRRTRSSRDACASSLSFACGTGFCFFDCCCLAVSPPSDPLVRLLRRGEDGMALVEGL